MGSIGCKYCNWDKENTEGNFEQMLPDKTPIPVPILKTNNNTDLNNNIININDVITSIKNENDEKNDTNLNNYNLKISNEKENEKEKENEIDTLENKNKDRNIPVQESISNNNNIIEENNYNIKQDEEFLVEERKDDNNINNKNMNNLKSNLEKSMTNQFSISSQTEAKNKVKNFEINKINFGLKNEDKENLNQEQKKLYKEAETNLQQFSAPQGAEISKLQTIMSNILLKLNKFFTNINLTSSNDNYKYILLNSVLKKMINYQINAHNTTMYSDRFCVLYPKMLKYYKSREQFLKNLSPICVLPIDQISALNIAKAKKSKNKNYHLIICNKLGIHKDFNNSIFLNVFDSSEINDYIASPDANESLLVFTSDEEKNIFQWYIVIQYLIEISKL
jgi:hypothetical protein